MKRVLLSSAALMLVASAVSAQYYGFLAISRDGDSIHCELPADYGIVTYYILYGEEFSWWGLTGVNFTAPQPACMTNAVYLGDINQLPGVVGNTQTGYSVSFACDWSGVICGIQYSISGPVTPCCEYQIFPQPVLSCMLGEWLDPSPRSAYIHATDDCRCAVPVQESTWGHVKALFYE